MRGGDELSAGRIGDSEADQFLQKRGRRLRVGYGEALSVICNFCAVPLWGIISHNKFPHRRL